MEIRNIQYHDVLFCKDKNLIFKSHYEYFGIVVDSIVISFLSIEKKDTTIKIRSNYTRPEHRKKGYMKSLIQYVLAQYPNYIFRVDAIETSYKIYRNLGFETTNEKQFKHFKIYYMRRQP